MSSNLRPIIYLITSGELTDQNLDQSLPAFLDTLRQAAREKITYIQIREKSLSAKNLFDVSSAAIDVIGGTATRVLVNDRADIAAAAGAHGVHLTASSLPAIEIRRRFPSSFIIAESVHSQIETVEASRHADFAVFAPVFATPGKGPPRGLDMLSEACRRVKPFPVVALGGVEPENCVFAVEAGAAGVAGIRYFNNIESLREISSRLNR